MAATVVLFTRDLRVHDHPALHEAVRRGDLVVPLFVLDPTILRRSARNRIAYLVEALTDLREALRSRGGDLFVRYGDTVTETMRVAEITGAGAIHLSYDVGRMAQRRQRHLRRAAEGSRLAVTTFPGVTVVPPLEVTPAGGDHYRVFTPYWRAWEAHTWRRRLPAPQRLHVPNDLPSERLPDATLRDQGRGPLSPERQRGGESPARQRLRTWLDSGIAGYAEGSDMLAADATSRLSADLRFGCLSPLELAREARGRPGADAFVRQLAWRDFHHQVTAAFPGIARQDYRSRDTTWVSDTEGLALWRAGQTGVPIVDAGMRQLLREGFMHNRARLITASFLTRTMGVHWTCGGDHFHEVLCDGDIADNYGNWQWVAGTGNDTRPNRRFNPLRQAQRFDPEGEYVRRYVPELAGLDAAEAHWPWRSSRRPAEYPLPILDPEGAAGTGARPLG
ncbi:cryptochrome/photolyase family protein [Salinactinospora qingdaonensis]|uniref:Deoxyribodipyrimidine photo-lyase n=1 Tax=Salinactinospora qingdaonensis TaxID=702744 RepID=A0ABP7GGZ2_9ACTN